MLDIQEEKIKDILTKGGQIELKEVIDKLSKDLSKQTFYNKIRKVPLDKAFVDLIKSRLKIDLEVELEKTNKEAGIYTREHLISEALRLHAKLEEVLEKSSKDKDKIIELQEKIDHLKDQLGRNQA